MRKQLRSQEQQHGPDTTKKGLEALITNSLISSRWPPGDTKGDFPFKLFEVDHRVPRSRSGTDHLENLQLLYSSCNRIKGNRGQEYLVTKLAEIGV